MRDNGTGSLFDLKALRSRDKTLKSRGQIVITWPYKNNNIVCVYYRFRFIYSKQIKLFEPHLDLYQSLYDLFA